MNMAMRVHQSVIEVLISEAAGRSATFADLLASLPGVCPTDAAAGLDHLAARRLIDPVTAERLNPFSQPQAGCDARTAPDDALPHPHPLDYDWRFSQETAELLRARCIQLSDPGDTIALLGTPTVLQAAAVRPNCRQWALLEASAAITVVLDKVAPGHIMRCDLARDALPRLDARVVAADPPWYAAHTRVFL